MGPARCAGCRLRLGPLCGECRDLIPPVVVRTPPAPASRLICGWPYEGAARSLVLDLKARAIRSAAEPLVEAMTAAIWKSGLAGSVITWVPGRPGEERRRGFDHAHLLARGLGNRLGLPVKRLLDRTGAGRDQVGLSAQERLENLDGAFKGRPLLPGRDASGRSFGTSRKNDRLANEFTKSLPQGPIVALVDDVLTTGATASACAGALLAAGASRVEVVVACSAE